MENTKTRSQKVGADAMTIGLCLVLLATGGYVAVWAFQMMGDSVQEMLGYGNRAHIDCRHILGSNGEPLHEWKVRSDGSWMLEPRDPVDAYEECVRIHGLPPRGYVPSRY